MGRMFDVLRRTDAKREGQPPAGAANGEDDFVSDFANEEVPFIEVGGAGNLQASSAVLAARPRHLRIVPQPQPDAGPILDEAPEPPAPGVGVCLRPLPGGLALLPPEQRFAADLVAFHQPDHPAGDDYRQLATALHAGAVPGQGRVLLCMGVKAGAGTTSVVLNLAVCLARDGEARVVVVDADEVRPAVAERLGLRGRPGLAEVLAGSESLDRALQDTGLDGLTALTAGAADPEGTAGWVGEACRPVLRLLRDRSDLVLIDAGSDLGGLGKICDAVYLVVPHGEAEAPATAERVRALLRKGAPLRGLILTGH